MKYSHVFDIAFELESDTEDASDVTVRMLSTALLRRVASLLDNEDEFLEAAGGPFDTCEVKEIKPC